MHACQLIENPENPVECFVEETQETLRLGGSFSFFVIVFGVVSQEFRGNPVGVLELEGFALFHFLSFDFFLLLGSQLSAAFISRIINSHGTSLSDIGSRVQHNHFESNIPDVDVERTRG